MVRKSTLVLIIVISALMFYVGCDDDDGGGGQAEPTPTPTGSPPPGGGAPPGACDNCPCNFADVPKTDECWVSDDTGPTFDPGAGVPGERCSLYPADLGFGQGLVVFLGIANACPQGQACCRILGLNSDTCQVPNETFELSIDNLDQVRACQACIEEYATDLNALGIAVSGGEGADGGPPYICITR